MGGGRTSIVFETFVLSSPKIWLHAHSATSPSQQRMGTPSSMVHPRRVEEQPYSSSWRHSATSRCKLRIRVRKIAMVAMFKAIVPSRPAGCG